jgi:hypothetical protein
MENISYRSNGILALSKVLNKKNNINIIEKMVYKNVSVLHEINIEKQYKQHLFQVRTRWFYFKTIRSSRRYTKLYKMWFKQNILSF